MGIIRVEFKGSFPGNLFPPRHFEARLHGHAEAVAEAIAYLSEVSLPIALKLDHRLHKEGALPANGFGKTYKDAYPEEG